MKETPPEPSVERLRLELEQTRLEQEMSIRREQLQLDRQRVEFETTRRRLSPVATTFLAASVGVVGTFVGAYWQGRTNTELARREFEFSLVERAFENPDQDRAAEYLSFLAETGLIQDPGLSERVAQYIKTPDSIPSLPSALTAGRTTPLCPSVTFDLAAGTINDVPATASHREIKTALPCWTGETEGGVANYGGGVFFLNHDVYVYTAQDRIEARANFIGSLVPDVLETDTAAVASLLGNPLFRTPGAFGGDLWYYRRPYGCLTLEISSARVGVVNASYVDCAERRRQHASG